MRKVVMLAAMMAIILALAAGVASARTFVCDDNPCEGTNRADTIGEQNGSVPDTIRGLGGNDRLNAGRFGNDRDDVLGQRGNDRLNVADGDTRDNANCGAGNNDVAIVDVKENDDSFGLDGVSNCEDILVPDLDDNGEGSGSLSSMSGKQLEANTRPATDAEVAAAEAAYKGK